MKKLFLTIFLIGSAFTVVFAQIEKSSAATARRVLPNGKPIVANGISEDKWNALVAAISREDWTETSFLAEDYMKQLKAETQDRQLARLRYIYLYALAGQIVDFSVAGKKVGEENTRQELRRAAEQFTGEDFLLPVRKIRADCEGVLNYVCPSKENSDVLRIASTNSNGTSVHSFDYVKMKGAKLDTVRHGSKDVILGGTLEKAEFNPNKSNVWIMRLIFKDGYVKEIHGKD